MTTVLPHAIILYRTTGVYRKQSCCDFIERFVKWDHAVWNAQLMFSFNFLSVLPAVVLPHIKTSALCTVQVVLAEYIHDGAAGDWIFHMLRVLQKWQTERKRCRSLLFSNNSAATDHLDGFSHVHIPWILILHFSTEIGKKEHEVWILLTNHCHNIRYVSELLHCTDWNIGWHDQMKA